MQTMQKFAEGYLTDLGVWPEDANTIVEDIKNEPGMKSIRWGSDVTTYSPIVLPVLRATLKYVGLKWIKENMPQALNYDIHLTKRKETT